LKEEGAALRPPRPIERFLCHQGASQRQVVSLVSYGVRRTP
jgi:hypothetical protein